MGLTYKALGEEGRLANGLWQIASTLGLAHRNGEMTSFPEWEYEKWFEFPQGLFGGSFGTDSTELATDIHPNHRPYLQKLSYWWDIRETIFEYFQPNDFAVDVISQFYDWYGSSTDRTAVHVRRTDAVAKQSLFKVPDMSYFSLAMETVAKEFPSTVFLIFSDDIEWCKENFPSMAAGSEVVFVSEKLPDPKRNYRGDPLGNRYDIYEFFLMRDCSHHITSNSTFSWWAAMLSGDSSPITPKQWYNGRYIEEIDLDNFLLPSWRRM